MNEFYNNHYIRIDENGIIVDRWSDGPHPDRDTSGAICINDQGGYQFRLEPDGEENPDLVNDSGISLYKWNGKAAIPRTDAEIQADIDALPLPVVVPTASEQLRADIDYIAMEMGVNLNV